MISPPCYSRIRIGILSSSYPRLLFFISFYLMKSFLLRVMPCIALILAFPSLDALSSSMSIFPTLVETRSTALAGNILVVDAFTREALPGARLQVRGKSIGTVANAKGELLLSTQISDSDTIVVTYMGYRPFTVLAGNLTSRIELTPAVLTSQQVAVTASRQQQLRSEMPTAISVISKQLIEETKPTMMYEIMNKVSGVNMSNLGNEQHSMTIRSPMTTRALFLYLEDGIPIRTIGVFNHNAMMEINMNALRNVEVIKGPGSAMYGANAISGAVNFLTQRASAVPVLELGVQGDSYGYMRGNWQAGNTFNIGQGLGLYTSGYYAQQKNSWRDYNSMEKLSASMRADYRIGSATTLEATYSVNNLRTDMPGGIDSAMFFSKNYPSNNTIAYRDNRAQRGRVTLDHTIDDAQNIRVSLFYRNNQLLMLPSFRLTNDRTNPRGAFGERSDTRFTSIGMDAQYRVTTRLFDMPLNVVTGLYYDNSPHTVRTNFVSVTREQRGVSTFYTSATIRDSLLTSYDVGLSNIAGYMQAELQIRPQMKFIAGVRYDRLVYGFDNNLPPSAFTGSPDQTTSYNNIAPRLGLIYNTDQNTGIYANYSIGFLPPELSELFRGVRTPNLTQADFTNYEIGGWWSFFGGQAYLDMSGYWMDGRNEVISVQTDLNVFENRNAGATRHYGIEFQIGGTITDELQLRISGTWSRHIFRTHRERIGGVERVFDNNDMPQAPNWITYSELQYKPSWLQGFRISAELQTQGTYFQDTQNSTQYNGHTIMHLRAGYRLHGVDIFVNAMNIFNTLYAETSSRSAFGYSYTPGNPRIISVGISYIFLHTLQR